MKNAKYILLALATVMLSACEKDDIGGTATEALAGDWYVIVTCVDDEGNTIYEDEDFFGLGYTHLLTYNTAANVADEMFVDDQGNFWEYKVRVVADQKALTFSTDGSVANEAYDNCDVVIEDGQVIYGAATTPSGAAADSIVFYVSFSDDPYPDYYGYSKYKISGYRYTGLTADD